MNPQLVSTASATTIPVYPSPYGDESCGASVSDTTLFPERRETYGNGRIIDISHCYHPNMPAFLSNDVIGQFLWLSKTIKKSAPYKSEMKLPIHTGTLVDVPGHFYDDYFDAGFDVDTLDLDVLNGPALLVDVPRDGNITGALCSRSVILVMLVP